MRYSAVDAFCGAGGLSLGLQNAGFQVLYGFDYESTCIKTLKLNPEHFPHLVEQQDIRKIDGGQLLSRLGLKQGELDVLAGGPPCQGFSVQRTVGDDEDDRNMLVHHYGNLIEDVLPKFFLMENVAGIGGKRGRKILSDFVSRMEAAGYNVRSKILDAQFFGVPQRRRRLFVVGELLGANRLPTFHWPIESESCAPSVRDVIGHLPPTPEDFSDHPEFPGHRADRISEKNRERLLALKGGQGRVDLPQELVADCHQNSADKIGHRNVYGRMNWDDIAPTITARFDSFTRGQFGHPDQTRTISIYEGSLLQTFPPKFRFAGTKVEMARQIGNAVPPRLAQVLGEAILKSLKLQQCELELVG